MIKVLHLLTTLGRGGLERWLLSLQEEMLLRGVAMDFCCKGNDLGCWSEAAQSAGARVLLCPLRPTQVGFVRGLRRIVESGGYQILHSHLAVYSGLAVWVARRQRIPVITSFHSTESPPFFWWGRFPGLRHLRDTYARCSINYAVNRSDFVTGCSIAALRKFCPEQANGNGRARVVYYGVRMTPKLATPEERAAFRAQLGFPEDAPTVIHVGRFSDEKNHWGVLQVFSRVVNIIPQARLVLVGDGPLRPETQLWAATLGLTPVVRFLGPREDVPQILPKCDLFLFPSHFEGLPVAAIEANAAGLPVVGSRIAGTVEAVEDGTTAILHEAKDLDGMSASVVRLLSDKSLSKELGQAGRRRAQERFSVAASATCLEQLYHECLSFYECAARPDR